MWRGVAWRGVGWRGVAANVDFPNSGCATGTTTITGIANQRVKECDRIAAMCSQLRRFGVPCEERADGLVVTGLGSVPALLPPQGPVACYGDHRVAMAFAALGSALPGVKIGDSRCVEKTYPQFWDHLETCVGATVAACDDRYGVADTHCPFVEG